MLRLRTWALVAGAALLLGWGALHTLLDGDLRAPLGSSLSALLGHEVRLDGDIRFRASRGLGVAVERVFVDGLGEVRELELGIDPWQLLRGVLSVRKLAIRGGRLDLEESDFVDAVPEEAAEDPGLIPVNFEVRGLAAQDLEVTVRDQTAAPSLRLALERLDVKGKARDEPLRVAAAGTVNGLPFDLSGQVGSLLALQDPALEFPVALEGTIANADFRTEGALDQPLGLSQLALRFSMTAADLGTLFASERLSGLGPLEAHALLTDHDGTLGVEDVSIRLGGNAGEFEVVLSGELDDLSERDEIAFALQLGARDLAALGRDLPPLGPIALSGRLFGSDEAFSAEALELRFAGSEFHGSASGSFLPGERPRLDADVSSPHLDLTRLSVPPSASARPASGGAGFRLPETLPPLDARVELRADQLTGRYGLQLGELRAVLLLEENHLGLAEIEGIWSRGALAGEMHLSIEGNEAVVRAEGDLDEAAIHDFLAELQEEPALTGTVDASFNLQSRGRSASSLRSNLDGDVVVVVREGTVSSEHVRVFERDLVRALRSWSSNEQVGEEPLEAFECLIGAVAIEEGVARVEALWLETETVIISGQGSVDLRAGTYDLTLDPQPKEQGTLSVAPKVHVTGTLEEPRFEPVKSSLVASAVSGLFSGLKRMGEATGRGLGLRGRELIDRERGKVGLGDPCSEAFEPGGPLASADEQRATGPAP